MFRLLMLLAVACALLPSPASAQQAEPRAYQDWSLHCPEGRTPPCVLHQRVVNDEQQQLLELVVDYRAAEAVHTLLVEVPLGIYLPAGAKVVVDGAQEFTGLTITRCLEGGCLVEGIMTPEMLAAMKRGIRASVVVGMPDGRRLAIVFSLSGFTAAVAALDQANAQ